MARTDRGPLLSSVVLVGLATMATALLVLIGMQAVKPFGPRNANESGPGFNGETVIPVPSRTTSAPKTAGPPAAGPASTAPTGTAPTGRESTQAPSGRTPRGTATTPPATGPTKAPKPGTTSPAPLPSQTTATTRPTPPPSASPTPSPTCTATDRSGKCKEKSDTVPTAQPGTATRESWTPTGPAARTNPNGKAVAQGRQKRARRA